jgi:hypothetical protein
VRIVQYGFVFILLGLGATGCKPAPRPVGTQVRNAAWSELGIVFPSANVWQEFESIAAKMSSVDGDTWTLTNLYKYSKGQERIIHTGGSVVVVFEDSGQLSEVVAAVEHGLGNLGWLRLEQPECIYRVYLSPNYMQAVCIKVGPLYASDHTAVPNLNGIEVGLFRLRGLGSMPKPNMSKLTM